MYSICKKHLKRNKTKQDKRFHKLLKICFLYFYLIKQLLVKKSFAEARLKKTLTLRSLFMPTPTVINKYRYSDVINRRNWDNKYFFTQCNINPVISKLGGGAAAGAASEVDIWTDAKSIFEYFNIAGNTNLGPKLDGSFGLNLAPDATSTHGVEYGAGITPQSNMTFLIANNPFSLPWDPGNEPMIPYRAFFVKGQFQIATVAGCTLEIGFRQQAAYNATLASYVNFASIACIAGEFEIQTQLASAGVVTTDTTQAATNAVMFELAVMVDSFGNVTYQVNDLPPVVTAAYQFANAITVIPFLRIIQNATTTATASCNWFECGYQS
jgi:hypothetical protein